jgi:hypothetical protein
MGLTPEHDDGIALIAEGVKGDVLGFLHRGAGQLVLEEQRRAPALHVAVNVLRLDDGAEAASQHRPVRG